MRRGEVGVVVCYAVDRLAREQTHFSILLDEADRVGAEFLFVTEKFENTPIGKMVLSAKSFAAELEREKIRERTMRGKLARVQGGRLAGNTPAPFGLQYSDDKSRYVAKGPEASVVRRIFTMAATGGTTRRIQMTLNEEGVPAPRGGQWCHRTIAAVLSNEVYHRTGGVAEVAHEKGTREDNADDAAR
jgi:site-specific DNA recombinase